MEHPSEQYQPRLLVANFEDGVRVNDLVDKYSAVQGTMINRERSRTALTACVLTFNSVQDAMACAKLHTTTRIKDETILVKPLVACIYTGYSDCSGDIFHMSTTASLPRGLLMPDGAPQRRPVHSLRARLASRRLSHKAVPLRGRLGNCRSRRARRSTNVRARSRT